MSRVNKNRKPKDRIVIGAEHRKLSFLHGKYEVSELRNISKPNIPEIEKTEILARNKTT